MTLTLGALHTYAAIRSQSMNADGIAYLDIGDAYFRLDWTNALNAVWSPLYSWILGLINFIFKPAMAWEFPTVHIVNFFIYGLALVSFEFMWARVRRPNPQVDSTTLPEPLWWTLGYLLFIWTSLSLIQIWSVTPDMLMAALVYLSAGLFAQIRSGDDQPRLFLSLGLLLGLGYLSKTFMFSIALVFLTLTWFVQKRTRLALAKTLLSIAVFLLVSLPFILVISNLKGKFTIGESGTVTYVRHVVGIPYPHWQGNPALGIVPAHPSHLIHEAPPVYEFGEPIGGTYPITLDPSYWYEGIQVQMGADTLIRSLVSSGSFYLDLFFQRQGIFLACFIVLSLMVQPTRQPLLDVLNRWALVIPAVVAFGLYGLVLVANRYIGVWVLLFWADILANIRVSNAKENRSWLRALSGVAVLGLLVNIILFNLDGFARLNPSSASDFGEPVAAAAQPLAVAQTLQELGLKSGDTVGVIGYAYDSFWARLARVQIVAEMLEADATELWHSDDTVQNSVLQAFAEAGVRAVIAEDVPEGIDMTGWHQVGNSNYYIHIFVE